MVVNNLEEGCGDHAGIISSIIGICGNQELC